MRRIAKAGAALAVLVGVGSSPADAWADVSGWLQMGGGGLGWQNGPDDEFKFSPTVVIDGGVGTSDRNPFIVGGLFRLQPVLEHGTDVAWAARFATQGFQSGQFGIAIDAGPYVRGWEVGSTGVLGQALLGLPVGLQLAVLGSYGTQEAASFGVTLGLDLARLTVHRKNLLEWWPNPRSEDALEQHAGIRW